MNRHASIRSTLSFTQNKSVGQHFTYGVLGLLFLLLAASSSLLAQSDDSADRLANPEGYKFRVGGEFWYATPTGTIAGSTTEGPINFQTDLHFNTYATFSAAADWHFAKKHHLFILISPNEVSRTVVLNRTITFRGVTYEEGSSVNGKIDNYLYAPGYRYDIIHRNGGHLGIVAQFNLLDIKASITGVANTTTGTTTTTASASLLAPIPVLGPDARVYIFKNHAFVDANIKGMYFFGYGNYISAAGAGGIRIGRHIDVIGGYQMGSHLVINGNSTVATNSRLSIRETQRGATAGLEFNFGERHEREKK